jgi:hypothetical protein
LGWTSTFGSSDGRSGSGHDASRGAVIAFQALPLDQLDFVERAGPGSRCSNLRPQLLPRGRARPPALVAPFTATACRSGSAALAALSSLAARRCGHLTKVSDGSHVSPIGATCGFQPSHRLQTADSRSTWISHDRDCQHLYECKGAAPGAVDRRASCAMRCVMRSRAKRRPSLQVRWSGSTPRMGPAAPSWRLTPKISVTGFQYNDGLCDEAEVWSLKAIARHH